MNHRMAGCPRQSLLLALGVGALLLNACGTEGTVNSDVGTTDAAQGDVGPADAGGDVGISDAEGSDASRADAGQADAGPVPGVVCMGNKPAFPPFSKACAVDADCVAVTHQINCCGTDIALAVAKSEATAYQAAEATCRAQYPGCGCASEPTVAEDGQIALWNSPVVAVCKAGACMATVPSNAGKCDVSGVKQPQPYKWCQSSDDCAHVLHQVDCCGSQIAWGVTKTSKALIESTEAACVKLQPICDCAPKPTSTEDGAVVGRGVITTSCDAGRCLTATK